MFRRGSRSRYQKRSIKGKSGRALKVESPLASIAVVTAIAIQTPRIGRCRPVRACSRREGVSAIKVISWTLQDYGRRQRRFLQRDLEGLKRLVQSLLGMPLGGIPMALTLA